uniref:Secreted protein n=1 Tax=Anguilla anguilla TaxID=7936 RepID=A0A0E9QBL9_ANGAN
MLSLVLLLLSEGCVFGVILEPYIKVPLLLGQRYQCTSRAAFDKWATKGPFKTSGMHCFDE